MTQIKSKKAGKYIDAKSYWVKTGNNTQTLVIHFAEAEQAVIIAETEAEERHAKELQELKDKAVTAFKYACPAYDDGREMCWLKNGESNQKCEYECKSIKEFIAKLNEL